MSRKVTLILVILLTGSIFYFSLPYLNGRNRYFNYLNYIFRGNNLHVSCSKNLDVTNIVLVFENETALIQHTDRKKAEAMLNRSHPYKLMRDTIFANGKQLMDIPYDYGKQRLAVYYTNEYIGELHHWQTNHYHAHDYTVHVKNAKGMLILNGKTSGPDVMYPVMR